MKAKLKNQKLVESQQRGKEERKILIQRRNYSSKIIGSRFNFRDGIDKNQNDVQNDSAILESKSVITEKNYGCFWHCEQLAKNILEFSKLNENQSSIGSDKILKQFSEEEIFNSIALLAGPGQDEGRFDAFVGVYRPVEMNVRKSGYSESKHLFKERKKITADGTLEFCLDIDETDWPIGTDRNENCWLKLIVWSKLM